MLTNNKDLIVDTVIVGKGELNLKVYGDLVIEGSLEVRGGADADDIMIALLPDINTTSEIAWKFPTVMVKGLVSASGDGDVVVRGAARFIHDNFNKPIKGRVGSRRL